VNTVLRFIALATLCALAAEAIFVGVSW